MPSHIHEVLFLQFFVAGWEARETVRGIKRQVSGVGIASGENIGTKAEAKSGAARICGRMGSIANDRGAGPGGAEIRLFGPGAIPEVSSGYGA